ncbi:MAG: hypothetical protein ACRDV3_10170 [Acidothermaceae bacterium]
MLNDLEDQVRAHLEVFADEAITEIPPVEALYARYERANRRHRNRRKLSWLAIPTITVAAAAGGTVAIAAGGAPSIVSHGFNVAKHWNKAWNIPAANTKLVASAIGTDGTHAQYWLGVSATSKAQCEQWIFQPAGQPWRSEGESCIQVDALPDPTLLEAGGGPTPTKEVLVYFHAPLTATAILLRFADGATSTVPVTTSGFALTLLPNGMPAASATALDDAGNNVGSTDLGWTVITGQSSE